MSQALGYNIPKDIHVRPELGQTAVRDEVTYEEKFENGKAKHLDRRSLQYGYLRCVSMMNVVLAPFQQSIFTNEVFMNYMNRCREWIIKKCSETNQTAVLLNFRTVLEGDQAWRDLSSAFMDSADVRVFQPTYSNDMDLFQNHVSTSSEWVLNECHFGVREFQEQFFKRLILLENVPLSTELELREEFPEALNILDFSYDPDCPGMVAIEVYDTDQGSEFITKYMRHSMKGQRILVDWFVTREKRHNHLMKKWKEKKNKKGFPPLSDPERLDVVRRFYQLRDVREKVMSRTDLIGLDKLREVATYKGQIQDLQDQLYADAKRRYSLGLSVPEPESDQILIVKKLMTGELEQARAMNQMITKMDLDRQQKERELDALKYGMSSPMSLFPGSKRAADGPFDLPGFPPPKRLMSMGMGGMRGARGGRGMDWRGGRGARGVRGHRGRSGYAVPNTRPVESPGSPKVEALMAKVEKLEKIAETLSDDGASFRGGVRGASRGVRGGDRGVRGGYRGARGADRGSRGGGMGAGIGRGGGRGGFTGSDRGGGGGFRGARGDGFMGGGGYGGGRGAFGAQSSYGFTDWQSGGVVNMSDCYGTTW